MRVKKVLTLLTVAEIILTISLGSVLSVSRILSPSAESAAGVPQLLSYQGRITNLAGDGLSGLFCMQFSLWDHPSSTATNRKIWSSYATPATTTIDVVSGVFNAAIGSSTDNPLTSVNFYPTSSMYLEIAINRTTSTCVSDYETLTPRQQILANAYAISAENVYGDIIKAFARNTSSSVQLGTGSGAATSSITYLHLDVTNVAQSIGGQCTPNGTLWYNSNVANTQTLVCNNGIIKPVGNDVVDIQTFTAVASNTWTKPSKGNLVRIQIWGAGGSGGRGGAADAGGGGGGGGYLEVLVASSTLSATEICSVGAGGPAKTVDEANGETGGRTTFDGYTVYGGGPGLGNTATDGGGGGGGGIFGAGTIGTATAGGAGGFGGGSGTAGSAPGALGGPYGGGGGSAAGGGSGDWGGGGGGFGQDSGSNGAPGYSIWGGSGGEGGNGAADPTAIADSLFGGDGGQGSTAGTAATNGAQPGGGGGGSEQGTTGAGGAGKCIITVFN